MPTKTKLIVSDPVSRRICRMTSDGSGFETWGMLYKFGEFTITYATNGVAWDESRKRAYIAQDNGGVRYCELDDMTEGLWDVVGGQVAHLRCYGPILTPDKSKALVMHSAYVYSADCVDVATNTRDWNVAVPSSWDLQWGFSNHVGTYFYAYKGKHWGSYAGNLPIARFKVSDGAANACGWSPPANLVVLDVDINAADTYIYVLVHFSSTPAGGTRTAIVVLDAALNYISINYISALIVPNLSAWEESGCIDAEADYFCVAWKYAASEWRGSVFRLSTGAHIQTYTRTTDPKWCGTANIDSNQLWAIRGASVLVSETKYLAYQRCDSFFGVDPVSLVLTERYRVIDTSSLSEYQIETGTYVDRKWGDLGDQSCTGVVTAGDGYFLIGNWKIRGIVLFARNFPFSEPTSIWRASNGKLVVADGLARRTWRFTEYGGSQDGATLWNASVSSYQEYKAVAVNETPSPWRVAFEHGEPTDYAAWVDYWSWTNLVQSVIPGSLEVKFYYQRENYLYMTAFFSAQAVLWQVVGEDFAGKTALDLDVLGITDPLGIFKDSDGEFFLSVMNPTLEVGVHKFNDMVGSGKVHFGSKGSGVNQFDRPAGVACDGTYCYVADCDNERIARFDKTAFDGTGWATFGSRGVVGDNRFISPWNLVFYLESIVVKSEEDAPVWDREPEWPYQELDSVPSHKSEFTGAMEASSQWLTGWGQRSFVCKYVEDEAGIRAIRAFWGGRRGKHRYFFFKNFDDYSRVGYSVGSGDGSRTEWRLPHEPIKDDSEIIYLAGVAKVRDVHYTICNDTGIITFVSPPGLAVAITADYEFYHRVVLDMPNCRIDSDGCGRYLATLTVREISLSRIDFVGVGYGDGGYGDGGYGR